MNFQEYKLLEKHIGMSSFQARPSKTTPPNSHDKAKNVWFLKFHQEILVVCAWGLPKALLFYFEVDGVPSSRRPYHSGYLCNSYTKEVDQESRGTVTLVIKFSPTPKPQSWLQRDFLLAGVLGRREKRTCFGGGCWGVN